MDKNRKREILNRYKRDELEKLSQSDNEILADFAKNKLGLKSDALTLERLRNTQDNKLIETIANKVKEVLEVRYKVDPKRYRNADNVVHELTESLRAIHFTHIFEMYVLIGDTEKFLDGATSYELIELLNGYRLFDLAEIADKISRRTTADIESGLSDHKRVEKVKVKYIREHLNEFELN